MGEIGYVIVYRADRSKRVRTINSKGEGELTPFFYTPDEALHWSSKRLNSPYVTIKKVGGDSNERI